MEVLGDQIPRGGQLPGPNQRHAVQEPDRHAIAHHFDAVDLDGVRSCILADHPGHGSLVSSLLQVVEGPFRQVNRHHDDRRRGHDGPQGHTDTGADQSAGGAHPECEEHQGGGQHDRRQVRHEQQCGLSRETGLSEVEQHPRGGERGHERDADGDAGQQARLLLSHLHVGAGDPRDQRTLSCLEHAPSDIEEQRHVAAEKGLVL